MIQKNIEWRKFEMLEMTRDLHASDYSAKEITTEYEDKFRNGGKNKKISAYEQNGFYNFFNN